MKKIFVHIALAVLCAALAPAEQVAFERDGVRADRATGLVGISASATGIEAGSPVEFVLISNKSGHAYEALATTAAAAKDIRAALEFIGLRPGRPVDERELRFWPRGSQVDVAIRRTAGDGEKDAGQSLPVAGYLYDGRSESVPNPFTFVGSVEIEHSSDKQKRALAADVIEPYSLISTYNEPTTLIDLARQAPQGAEYGKTLPNPDRLMKEGERIEVVITPREGAPEEVDVLLRAEAAADGGVRACLVLDERGELLNENDSVSGAVACLAGMVAEGRTPFARVEFDQDLSIGAARSVCELIAAIDTQKGIRVEPPAQGDLYYKAFLPQPVMADREERGLQPPELHLSAAETESAAVLKQARREWSEDEPGRSWIAVESWQLTGPKDFEKRIVAVAGDMPVLIVCADDELPLRSMMKYVRTVLDRYRTVFVLPSEWMKE